MCWFWIKLWRWLLKGWNFDVDLNSCWRFTVTPVFGLYKIFSKSYGVCFLAVLFDQIKITGAGNMAQSVEALGTQAWWPEFSPRNLRWKKRPDSSELFSDLHMHRFPCLLKTQAHSCNQDSEGKTGGSMVLTSQPGQRQTASKHKLLRNDTPGSSLAHTNMLIPVFTHHRKKKNNFSISKEAIGKGKKTGSILVHFTFISQFKVLFG